MDKLVIIKSGKHGLVISMNDAAPFNDVLKELEERLSSSRSFFGEHETCLTLKGRSFYDSEIRQILRVISEASDIKVRALSCEESAEEAFFEEKLSGLAFSIGNTAARTIYRDITNGETIRSDISLVIAGNVERGAKIYSEGSIFVLGALYGSCYAGELGNNAARIFSSHYDAREASINGLFYRQDRQERENKKGFFKRRKEELRRNPLYLEVSDGRIYARELCSEAKDTE